MGADRQERVDVELVERRVHQHRAPRAVQNRIRETFAVNAWERRCLPYGTADGAAAGAGRVNESAGRGGDAAGARPPQPTPASTSAAVSTAGTTTARILVMAAEPTRPGTGP